MKSILLIKKLLGLVKMMSGLVNASFILPEWQAVKMIFFAPCRGVTELNHKNKGNYSACRNPTYGHLSNTVTLLLWSLFLATQQNGHTFSCKKNPH